MHLPIKDSIRKSFETSNVTWPDVRTATCASTRAFPVYLVLLDGQPCNIQTCGTWIGSRWTSTVWTLCSRRCRLAREGNCLEHCQNTCPAAGEELVRRERFLSTAIPMMGPQKQSDLSSALSSRIVCIPPSAVVFILGWLHK